MIFKSEAAITKGWVLNSEPIVSICCVTFNHEDFIEMALDSFLTQKTEFQFEIIVRDDCSTDGTTTIIKNYVKKYPSIIKPIFETENQYSKGVEPLSVVFKKATGRYFAICEGDDYWTEPNKLQKQVQFLEDNSEYSATVDNAWVKFDSGKKIPFSRKPERDISLKELAISRQFATGSIMCRALGEYPKTLKGFLFGDTPLALYLVKEGKVRYFDRFSSLYRRHSSGMTNQIGKSKENTDKVVEYNQQLNQFLDNEYKQIFSSRIAETYYDFAVYCFPNNVINFFKYLFKAARWDARGTAVSFLRKFLFIDKVTRKLASRNNDRQVFIE